MIELKSAMYLSLWFLLNLFFLFSQACRPEICRKRREVQQSDVLLQLRGCSGQTKPWVRQVAYCLRQSTAEIALTMRDWYEDTYLSCYEDCNMVRTGTTEMSDVAECVNCFKASLVGAPFIDGENASYGEIELCLDRFIFSALSNDLPTLEVETRSRGRITIPRVRPRNDWWALTVKLPCKPPLFQFWNAYCINSFADDLKSRDYLLAQNRLISSRDIVFIAKFNDACRFDISDVDIIWDESIPSQALPQLSSFPASFPPKREEHGHIFMDTKAYTRLENTDGGIPIEISGSRPRRKKRSSSPLPVLNTLGVIMPCLLRSFKVTDRIGVPVKVNSNKNRYIIDPTSLFDVDDEYRPQRIDDLSFLNFTIDFNYFLTGCIFDSSDVIVVPNPPRSWINGEAELMCYQCYGASSEEECRRTGTEIQCGRDEVCQSEVRQVTDTQISITKTCKQALACQNNQTNNKRLHCRPGKMPSVCHCCCYTDYCNGDSFRCHQAKTTALTMDL